MGVDAILEAFRNAEWVCLSDNATADNRDDGGADTLEIGRVRRTDQQTDSAHGCNPVSCYVDPNWTEEKRHEFEERAAIIEYDGQLTRNLAEFIAAGSVDSRRGHTNAKWTNEVADTPMSESGSEK